jgi:NAD(P) transhydrogenase subunit alpha
MFTDEAYEKAGATVSSDRSGSLKTADVVARLRKPPHEEIALLKKGSIHVSFLDPFNEHALIEEMLKCGITALSMEMIPRTTLAQKMDALSSQANLAGYVAVVVGAERLDKTLPMMMTPAGTIAPARVFVIGVGVAGLQAIATAKRLGARVDAFDTRPVVEEQVKSLGAKFVKVDLGETGQTKDGYAKELTADQQEKQRAAMAKVCAKSDLVITTAQLFGKKAPLIVTKDMIQAMKPGSVIVDLAVETGGNVEGSEVDQEITMNGVHILGLANLPGRVAVDASRMYSANLGSFIETYWDEKEERIVLDFEDEIIQGCVVTHNGDIQNKRINISQEA